MDRAAILPTIPTIRDLGNQDVVPLDGTVTALRFRAQQVSVDSVQTGLSLPKEIVSIREAETPRLTR